MIVLNFSHPLTELQREQIAKFIDGPLEEVRDIVVQINQDDALASQIVTIVDGTGLTALDWQTRPLLINPPGYAPAAFVLLAELHGRMGHFPTVLRLRPKHGPVTTFEVAEVLNLQTIREQARVRRQA